MSQITIRLSSKQEVTITQSDANDYIITYLRRIRSTEPQKNEVGYADYGYELYLEKLLIEYGIAKLEQSSSASGWHKLRSDISPVFMDACWELCRRGIIRPYTRTTSGQGSNNPGFTTTAFGRQWLNEVNLNDYVPTEPDRFAQMLEPFKEIFGASFYNRAQEAVRCYNAHAYLACCAMTGSSAENVLRATAEKLGGKVNTKTKFSELNRIIINKCAEVQKQKFRAYSDMVNTWRDSSMHHENLDIASQHAYNSLLHLLLLVKLCRDNWFSMD
jgi:hypothetical protein